LVSKHASQVSSCLPYTHDHFEDEIFTENSQDSDEVVARRADPKVRKLKVMSWEVLRTKHQYSIEKPQEKYSTP
jgi:hypothetical protein